MPNIITVRPAAAIIEGVTVDDRTPLGFPLPHKDNSPRQGDIDRLRDALLLIDLLLQFTPLLVDGKLPLSILPATAITDTFPVSSQAQMLALAAERGDVAVRSDVRKSYILRAEPATTIGNWQELLTPTDVVQSVAGLAGVITATDLKAALAIAPSDVSGLVTALGLLAAKTDLPVKASGTEVITGSNDAKFSTPKALIDAMAYVAFTAASINLASFINGKITLAANTTFAAATNAKEGQSGILAIAQDATGGRTGSFASFWDFGKAGVPTLSTAAGAVDYVSYAIPPGAAKAICTFWQAS